MKRKHAATMSGIGKIDVDKQKCVLLVCDIQDGRLLKKIHNEEKLRYVIFFLAYVRSTR